MTKSQWQIMLLKRVQEEKKEVRNKTTKCWLSKGKKGKRSEQMQGTIKGKHACVVVGCG